MLAALALAAPAGAEASEPHQVPAPADAPVVAGPTASGAELVAFDRGASLCVALRLGGERRPLADCERAPVRLRAPRLTGQSEGGRRPAMLQGGVVAGDVASVDFLLTGGRTVAVPTSPGDAYAGGHAGRVRFLLAEIPGAELDDLLYMRQRAPDGSVLALTDAGFGLPRPVAGSRVPLLRRRGLRVTAFERRALAALPDDPERFVPAACVAITEREGGSSGASFSCESPGRSAPELSASTTCRGTLVTAIVRPDVGRVVAVLGDGSRRTMRLRALRGALADRRVGLLVLAPRVAVRAVRVERAGRRAATFPVRIAPASTLCAPDFGAGIFIFGLQPRTPTVAEGARLVAEDRGALLCTAIGSIADSERDCWPPPLDVRDVRTVRATTESGTVLGAAVPPDVSSGEFVLDDGSRHRVEASDGPYAGRWRGRVRFLELTVPEHRLLAELRLRDAAGGLLERVYGFEAPPLAAPLRELLHDRSGLRLLRGSQPSRPGGRPEPCVVLGTPRAERDDFCDSTVTLSARATCRPRRLALYGLLPRSVRGLAVRTDRGVVPARVRRVPGGRRAALAVVPARAATRAVMLVRRRGRATEIPFAAPPAARQCGWRSLGVLLAVPDSR